MHKPFLLLLVSVSLTFANIIANLPEDLHSWALSSIDFVYKAEFEKAEHEAKKIIRKYNEHPAGYFFMAAVLNTWMNYYQSNEKEDEFFRFCDLAIEKSERILLKVPDDPWAKFFMGGAEGYKGTFEARYERWITAFRYGWKGVSILLDLQSKSIQITDINLGIGVYDYWRSAMMKILWWMPGVEDKRSIGIQKIELVRKQGLYTKTTASETLIEIYLNEKKYTDALTIAEEMLLVYPNSLFFKWGKAKALFSLLKLPEAQKVYTEILVTVESDKINNNYNVALCRFWLAKIAYDMGNYQNAIELCDSVSRLTLDVEIQKRLSKILDEMHGLRKNALSRAKS